MGSLSRPVGESWVQAARMASKRNSRGRFMAVAKIVRQSLRLFIGVPRDEVATLLGLTPSAQSTCSTVMPTLLRWPLDSYFRPRKRYALSGGLIGYQDFVQDFSRRGL